MKILLALGAALLLTAEPVSLFDGKTLTGWTTPLGKPITTGWDVQDGALHRAMRGGDIVTEKEYASFDLSFEWKVGAGVNSGLKYHYGKYGQKTIGIEYQLIDAAQKGDNVGKHSVGSIYDLFAADPKVQPKPAGEWNVSRIQVDGPKITHWLNGKITARVTMGSEEWNAALAKSKFRETSDFGTKPGKILLQDHGGEVWFRNLTLTELMPKEGR
jgi:hypothetical protein